MYYSKKKCKLNQYFHYYLIKIKFKTKFDKKYNFIKKFFLLYLLFSIFKF
jgi:hypothetical protein